MINVVPMLKKDCNMRAAYLDFLHFEQQKRKLQEIVKIYFRKWQSLKTSNIQPLKTSNILTDVEEANLKKYGLETIKEISQVQVVFRVF